MWKTWDPFTVQSNSELVRVFMLLLWNLRFHSQSIMNFNSYLKATMYIFLTFILFKFLVQTPKCTERALFFHSFVHENIKKNSQKEHSIRGFFFLQPRLPKMAQTQKSMLEVWPTNSLLDYTVDPLVGTFLHTLQQLQAKNPKSLFSQPSQSQGNLTSFFFFK